jgi:hypothetical protein
LSEKGTKRSNPIISGYPLKTIRGEQRDSAAAGKAEEVVTKRKISFVPENFFRNFSVKIVVKLAEGLGPTCDLW